MTDKTEGTSRRDFLKVATAAAPGALAAAAMPGQAAAGTTVERPQDPDRMQDTAHTRAYFDSARF